jgi:hypothetical protein
VILVSLALLGFAVADLLRWSPEPVSRDRAVLATIGATAATTALAALSGLRAVDVVVVAGTTLIVVAVWLACDQRQVKKSLGPGFPLAWIFAVIIGMLALSGSADPISGSLGRWYAGLGYSFNRSVTVDQFLLGASGLLSCSQRPTASSDSSSRLRARRQRPARAL